MRQRPAMTLMEVLVVIAIIAVLILLLLPAIQKVRDVANRTRSMNNLRQISLATQNFASIHSELLPNIFGGNRESPNPDDTLFVALMPYIEQGALYSQYRATTSDLGSDFIVKTYVSPADPSTRLGKLEGLASYGGNVQVFIRNPALTRSISDGLSNTIFFAEHYARCGNTQFGWFTRHPLILPTGAAMHRASFADAGPTVVWYDPGNSAAYTDAYPITTSGSTPTTTGSVQGLSFQVAPGVKDCDARVAQTPHPGGMLVALGDGSVRILGAEISPEVFWGALTPAAGETLGDQW